MARQAHTCAALPPSTGQRAGRNVLGRGREPLGARGHAMRRRAAGHRSALAELEASASGLLTVLLALLLVRVAGDVLGRLEFGAQIAVDLHQRARDAVADRAG